jgi:2'-5' RNA ligase
MRLFAALVPPRDVLDQVSQLAAGVYAEPEREPEPEPAPVAEVAHHPGRHAAPSARRFGRRTPPATSSRTASSRGQDTAPPPEPTGPLLDLVPLLRMHVPIVKFGNLALDVIAQLIDALEVQAASGWQSPRLHLHGGVALEPKGDHSVWVKMGGDLDELNAVVRDVYRVAQGLHLFVDRRMFRTDLQLGTINEHTTEAHVEALLAALEAFESPAWWQTTMSLLIPIDLGPDKAPYRLHREISLGPAVPH